MSNFYIAGHSRSLFLPPPPDAEAGGGSDVLDDFDDDDDEDYDYEDYEEEEEEGAGHGKDQDPGILPSDLKSYGKGEGKNDIFAGFGEDANKKSDNNNNRVTTLDSEDGLPRFVSEPEDGYIIRGRAARLTCAAAGADKAYFVCNGEAMAASPNHRERDQVDRLGLAVKSLSMEVGRNDVEEFFGRFRCRCDAWSKRGRVSSRNVTVQTACELFSLFCGKRVSSIFAGFASAFVH